jgi:formylglycine-generating enzyme required for sulfatase activity
MGSPAGEGDSDERPQHRVTIAAPFAVSKFELTFAAWDACAAAGGCNGYRPDDGGWGRGERPVINVSWDDAGAYVSWLAEKTGKPYRLLSEAEYEYAARAGTTTTYPWGGDIGKNNANCEDCGSRWDNKQTAPVGSFAPNQFGLYDMIGNVAEWTEDCWHTNYLNAPASGSAWTTGGSCAYRVTRGVAWAGPVKWLPSASRDFNSPDHRSSGLGFRVARTLLTR